jgi:hypothetical protein
LSLIFLMFLRVLNENFVQNLFQSTPYVTPYVDWTTLRKASVLSGVCVLLLWHLLYIENRI